MSFSYQSISFVNNGTKVQANIGDILEKCNQHTFWAVIEAKHRFSSYNIYTINGFELFRHLDCSNSYYELENNDLPLLARPLG